MGGRFILKCPFCYGVANFESTHDWHSGHRRWIECKNENCMIRPTSQVIGSDDDYKEDFAKLGNAWTLLKHPLRTWFRIRDSRNIYFVNDFEYITYETKKEELFDYSTGSPKLAKQTYYLTGNFSRDEVEQLELICGTDIFELQKKAVDWANKHYPEGL